MHSQYCGGSCAKKKGAWHRNDEAIPEKDPRNHACEENIVAVEAKIGAFLRKFRFRRGWRKSHRAWPRQMV